MDLGLNDVKATLADYFDGIYDSSEDKLRNAFHPDAHIYSATDGGVRHGTSLRNAISIGPDEARLLWNLTRSYIGFLLAEHRRLSEREEQ